MKKIISLILVTMAVTTSAFAHNGIELDGKDVPINEATFDVYLDGNLFVGDNKVLDVGGRTYMSLRDISEVLNIPIRWNEEHQRVEIGETDGTTICYPGFPLVPDFGDMFHIRPLSELREEDGDYFVAYYIFDIKEGYISEYKSHLTINGWRLTSHTNNNGIEAFQFENKDCPYIFGTVLEQDKAVFVMGNK